MGIANLAALAAVAFFALLFAALLFAAPLRLFVKLALHTLAGFAALLVLSLLRGVTGPLLGLNLANALTVGVFGLPGLALLLLLRLVFV